jgi:hypothetical protein
MAPPGRINRVKTPIYPSALLWVLRASKEGEGADAALPGVAQLALKTTQNPVSPALH